MRRPLALFVAFVAAPAVALAADAPELPKPPTTPLPAFENPLHDAEVGETCLYKVREPGNDDGWVRYFEERVLARRRLSAGDPELMGHAERVLVETIETNAEGTKEFGVINDATRWRDADPKLILPGTATFVAEKQKDELVYLGGTPPTKAVRTTRRVIEYPAMNERPDGAKTQLQIWFSHDVPVLGRAKQFPSVRDGERLAISWDKQLAADVCAKRAERYPDEELLAKQREKKAKEAEATPPVPPTPPTAEPGMGGEKPAEPAPAAPAAPTAPTAPDAPDAPTAPDAPRAPETPRAPDAPGSGGSSGD